VTAAHAWSALAVVGFVGGGAALGVGLVLLATAHASSAAPVKVGCAPGLAGVSCFGTF
jgi:hypothetical protein